MWNDARFRALSAPPPNGQTLFQRLLSGPELTNIPGVFTAGELALSEALGWDVEGFRKAFGEVFREGLAKADWKARLVWIPKAIAFNRPESPNVVRSWRQAWDEVPECALKTEAYHALKAFCEGMGEGFAKAFGEACPEPSPNQEQEQEQEQEKNREPSPVAPAQAVVELSSDQTPKAKRKARISETWTPSAKVVEQFQVEGLDVTRTAIEFRDYWLGRGDPRADWDATFRSWVRRISADGKIPRYVAPKAKTPPGEPFTPPPEGFAEALAGLRNPNEKLIADVLGTPETAA